MVALTYSTGGYSVNSLILEYLCHRWSDSHWVFAIAFLSKKLTTCHNFAIYEIPLFLDSKTNVDSFREIYPEVSLQNKCLHCRNKHYLQLDYANGEAMDLLSLYWLYFFPWVCSGLQVAR